MADVQSVQIEIDGALVARIQELEELVASYATNNEVQRKRIDELLARLKKANQRAEEEEAALDTATEALAWYADGTNYVAQLDGRGRKQRPIMVLKAYRAEGALRKIGRWPVRA